MMFWSAIAFAKDETVNLGTIVLSPTRLSESRYSVGKSVDVLGSDDMDAANHGWFFYNPRCSRQTSEWLGWINYDSYTRSAIYRHEIHA